jgi:hypothetical protein
MDFSGEFTQSVAQLSSIDDGSLQATFSGGATVRLPLTDAVALHQQQILELLKAQQLPAYIRAEDGVIKDVLAPKVGRVVRLERVSDTQIRVDITTAPERLELEANQTALLTSLTQSLVQGTDLVIVADRHRIVDVQAAPAQKLPQPAPLPANSAVMAGVAKIDENRAAGLFGLIKQQNCDLPPGGPTPPCIPFQYTLGYCFARAHRVCEMLKDQGVVAGKMWLFGDLRLHTANAPGDCLENWTFHVAPFVRADPASLRTLVFDPSVAPSGPIPGREWRQRIRGQSGRARLTFMDIQLLAADLKPVPGLKPTFCQDQLNIARHEFAIQCQTDGPPPYVCHR